MAIPGLAIMPLTTATAGARGRGFFFFCLERWCKSKAGLSSFKAFLELTVASWHILLWLSFTKGKSSLTVQFCDNHFVDSYYPTIEATFNKVIRYKGQEFATEIIDTAGQVGFWDGRYSATDVRRLFWERRMNKKGDKRRESRDFQFFMVSCVHFTG